MEPGFMLVVLLYCSVGGRDYIFRVGMLPWSWTCRLPLLLSRLVLPARAPDHRCSAHSARELKAPHSFG